MSKFETLSQPAKEALATFAANIIDARHARNWTEIEAATRAGISRTGYRAVEQGKPEASIGNYLLVLDAMGLAVGIRDVAAPHLDAERRILIRGKGRKKSKIKDGVES